MSDETSSDPEGFSQHKVAGELGDEASYAPSITLFAADADADDDDRRRAARNSYDVAVFVRAEETEIIGLCGDISEGGLFVTTHESLEQGTKVQLEVLLPDSDEEIMLQAEVRWRRDKPDDDAKVAPGFGVKFVDLTDEDRRHIDQIIAAVQAA